MEIKNRIIGSGNEPLDNILFNPRNWRIHPLNQQNALKGVLEEVGWVQNVIVNQRTGNLIDGHLRCQLAQREGANTIPVLYVDLSEEEEALILATLDPIAGMAATDKQKLEELMNEIESTNQGVQQLIEDIAIDKGIIEPQIDYEKEWQGMPEFNREPLAHRSIIIHFEKQEDVNEFAELIKQNITDATKSLWYPQKEKQDRISYGYINDES